MDILKAKIGGPESAEPTALPAVAAGGAAAPPSAAAHGGGGLFGGSSGVFGSGGGGLFGRGGAGGGPRDVHLPPLFAQGNVDAFAPPLKADDIRANLDSNPALLHARAPNGNSVRVRVLHPCFASG